MSVRANDQAQAASEGEEGMTFIGKDVEFQDEGSGTVVSENEDSIYIASKFFTGWMFKAEYFELLGIED